MDRYMTEKILNFMQSNFKAIDMSRDPSSPLISPNSRLTSPKNFYDINFD